MIIKPVRHPKKDSRIIFYKTGVIVFNENAVKTLGILAEHRFAFDIDANHIKLLFDKDGFKFAEKNLTRNVYRLNSRQACNLVFELFGTIDTKHLSYITEKEAAGNINLKLDSLESIKGNSANDL